MDVVVVRHAVNIQSSELKRLRVCVCLYVCYLNVLFSCHWLHVVQLHIEEEEDEAI